MSNDVFNGNGIKISLKEDQNFLKIKETLTRIGVASKKNNTLYQSCHILHKKGEYAILHFKELFLMDGKTNETEIEDNDYARRNTVVKLLAEWNLLDILDTEEVETPVADLSQIKIIPHKEKTNWQLVAKYSIGTKKRT